MARDMRLSQLSDCNTERWRKFHVKGLTSSTHNTREKKKKEENPEK